MHLNNCTRSHWTTFTNNFDICKWEAPRRYLGGGPLSDPGGGCLQGAELLLWLEPSGSRGRGTVPGPRDVSDSLHCPSPSPGQWDNCEVIGAQSEHESYILNFNPLWSRYYYETDCLNVTLPFRAFPWGSRSKVTWLAATEEGLLELTSEDDRGLPGTFHSVTKRIDHLALETILGKFVILF